MSQCVRTYRVGDGIPFFAQLVDGRGAPIDLSGFEVTFKFKLGSQPTLRRLATVVDAAAGRVAYLTQPEDFFLASEDCFREWEITDADTGRLAHAPVRRIKFAVIDPL